MATTIDPDLRNIDHDLRNLTDIVTDVFKIWALQANDWVAYVLITCIEHYFEGKIKLCNDYIYLYVNATALKVIMCLMLFFNLNTIAQINFANNSFVGGFLKYVLVRLIEFLTFLNFVYYLLKFVVFIKTQF